MVKQLFWVVLVFGWIWLGLHETEEIKIINHLPDLYNQIDSIGIKFPEVVYAQSAHETGLFEKKNKVFSENKNLWGLKVPYKRKTLAIGWNRGHAKFRSYGDCIQEYKNWQNIYLPSYERRYGIKVLTAEDYIQFLVRQGFAEDTRYADHLRKRTQQVQLAISQKKPHSEIKIN